MAIQYITQGVGQALIIGLSSDTKPVSPPDAWLFIESDTALIYNSVAGSWVIRTTGANLSLTDITTNDATTAKHGFMPKGTGSTSTFFRSDMTQAAPTASVAITETEIDVGTTPVAEASIAVTDAGISTSSKIIGGVAYKAPTNKDLDELEMDALEIKFEPATGSVNVHIKGLEGYIADKFIVWYTFA